MSSLIINSILQTSDVQLKSIAQKVVDAKRISDADAIWLYTHGELSVIGALANYVRERKNGNYTYFNRNFHIEPTNVCVFSCKFCAYSQDYKHSPGVYLKVHTPNDQEQLF